MMDNGSSQDNKSSSQNNNNASQDDSNLHEKTTAKNGTGLARVINATKCSVLGLKAAYKHEPAFRQELWFAFILTPIAAYISPTLSDFILLITVMLLVLIVELVNSAVESVVDRIGLERHELSGRAKDLGSAAVSLAILAAGLVWLVQIVQFFTS